MNMSNIVLYCVSYNHYMTEPCKPNVELSVRFTLDDVQSAIVANTFIAKHWLVRSYCCAPFLIVASLPESMTGPMAAAFRMPSRSG